MCSSRGSPTGWTPFSRPASANLRPRGRVRASAWMSFAQGGGEGGGPGLGVLGGGGGGRRRRHFPRPEAGNLGLPPELGGDALGFVGEEVGRDLDLDGFADWGKIFVVQQHCSAFR